MERFMRIAFWIFTFSVTLACCHPLSDYTRSELHHRLDEFNIEIMKDNVTCGNDSTFYIPKNIKDACRISALECIFKELNGPVLLECNNTDSIHQGLDTLELEIQKQKEDTTTTVSTNLSECACELWKEGSFSEFLEGYESLLKRINAGARK